MSGVQHPVWRAGIQRLIVVENPEAGHEWIVQVPTVPEGVWWRPKCIAFQLNTSAVAGNRTPRVLYLPSQPSSSNQLGTAYVIAGQATAAQGPAVVSNYCGAEVGETNGLSSLLFGLPLEVLVQPGHFIGTFTGALDAGDQYQNIRLLVQEYIYVPPVDYITGEIQAAATRIIAAVAEAGKSRCALVGGADQVGAPT